jgi:four helix bundle protein
LGVAYKEARKTMYWIKLLKATSYLPEQDASGLFMDAEEICKIIGKIQATFKNRNS